ncbi:hypothetical protein CANARDRAFT_26191 [[Candida] arabinofermentans NRRL YB-2248]|uniref:Glutaminase n=1 Tax=[Candida] arabinofermentans NRRL YB-2248 TaxID=983967 RepID=A0A1E4T8E3_9ASCO|nr:hypothetical protein CANARDRAFT_26191 [[Candida] arabinofermentans NRRL YB-2248]
MTSFKKIIVGVLALQGSFREHISHFNKLFDILSADPKYEDYKLSVRPIRKPNDLIGINALVLVGGESTAISILVQRSGLYEPLCELIQSGRIAIWGTCAGLILISKLVTNTKIDLGDLEYKVMGGLDVVIERNSFGRQLDSFTDVLHGFAGLGEEGGFDGVFIRAPVITKVLDKIEPIGSQLVDTQDFAVAPTISLNNAEVEILSTVNKGGKSLIVAVKQGHVLGTSFHPELVQDDYRFHRWFLDEFVITIYNSRNS